MSSWLHRDLFGVSVGTIWNQLAAEIGAEVVDGGFWKGARVEARHGDWRVTLQIVPYGRTRVTVMRAAFINQDGFRFRVYRKQIFSELGKLLGMQDVEVGHAEFDRDFVIQGTDDAKLRRLFANARIRELLTALPNVNFAAKDGPGLFTRDLFAEVPPENLTLLDFMVHGVLKDKAALKLMFDLFAETLDELCRMGSAYKERPKS